MDASPKIFICSDIAKLCGVDPKTVGRWSREIPRPQGKEGASLECFRTPGGHRRFTERHLIDYLGKEAYAQLQEIDQLLTSSDVAHVFSVDIKTVCRMSSRGVIGSILLPDGHYRYGLEHLTSIMDIDMIKRRLASSERLLTPAQVADSLRVNPKTVTRWAQAGKLTAYPTPGGHRRYDAGEVRRFLEPQNA